MKCLCFFCLQKPFFEALSSFSSGESEEKNMGSDPRISTTPKMIVGKLSSKKVPCL